MPFATYNFNAKSHHDPSFPSILHFARQPLMFSENYKISLSMILGRPNGMREAAGGDMRGSEICRYEIGEVGLWFWI